VKFVNFAKNWLNQKRNEVKSISFNSYQRLIENYVIPFLGNYEVEDINDEVLKEFETYLINLEVGNATLECTKRIVNSMLYPKERKEKEENGTETFLDNEQLIKFINYLKENNSRHNNLLLFTVLTGINIGELCGIKGKDIDFIDNTIYISTTVNRVNTNSKYEIQKTKLIQTKTTHVRTINVASEIMELLKTVKTSKQSFLVTGSTDLPDKRLLQKKLTDISKKLDMHITFKILQSTFIVNCIENGASLTQIAEYIGTSAENLKRRGYTEKTSVKEIIKFQKECVTC